MFDQKYFKKNKIYTINGYHYLVIDGGLSEGEDFEPTLIEKNGKESLEYRPIDRYQFSDGTFSDIKCMTVKDFLVEYGFYSTEFNNPFTRTLKITKGVNRINNWEGSIKPFNLRLSKKAEEEKKEILFEDLVKRQKENEKTMASLKKYEKKLRKAEEILRKEYSEEPQKIDTPSKILSKTKKK